MTEEQEQQLQQAFQYTMTEISIAINGLVLETFFSPIHSMKVILNEQQVNEVLKAWVENRKGLAEQQQLIHNVMRKKLH